MASVILGSLGSMVGGPIGGFIGGQLGSFIDGMIFNHKNKLPWIDRQVMASTMGLAIPQIIGRCKIGGNLIMSTPLSKKKRHGKSGKGGSSKSGNQDHYYVTCAVALGQDFFGQGITNIWRIYADSKLIWDMEPNNLTTFVGGLVSNGTTGGYVMGAVGKGSGSSKNSSQENTSNSFGKATFYYGTEDQPIDSTLDSITTAAVGANSCPAYRGIAYVVFEDFDVTNFGNRVPQFTFEVNGFYAGAKQQTTQPVQDNGLGLKIYDVVQNIYCKFNGQAGYSIRNAWNSSIIKEGAFTDFDFVNALAPYGIAAWAHKGMNSMFTPQGKVLLPLFGSNHYPYVGQPFMVEIDANDGPSSAYAIKPLTVSTTGVSYGVGLSTTPGPSYYCGTTDFYCIWDRDTPVFLFLDYSGGSPGQTAYSGQITASGTTIWGPNGATPVDQSHLGSPQFASCTCIAYSDSRKQVVFIDGARGKQWVLSLAGILPAFNGFEADLTALNLSGTSGQWVATYDPANDNYVYTNGVDVAVVHDPTVGSFGASVTAQHQTTWGAMFSASGLTMPFDQFLQQIPFGRMAAILDFGPNANTVQYYSTVDLSVIGGAGWSYSDANPNDGSGGIYLPYAQGGIAWIPDNRFSVYYRTAGGVPLSTTVAQVCRNSGIPDSAVDVSELTQDLVIGFPIPQEINGRGIIESLEEVYMFDMIDTGDKIVGRKRDFHAANPVMNIADEDLAARPATSEPGQNPQPRVTEVMKNDYDLPEVMSLKYRTTAADYYVPNYSHAQATIMDRRNHNASQSRTKISANSPLVLPNLAALQATEITLKVAYAQRTTITCSVPISYIGLEAGDNVVVNWTDEYGAAQSRQIVIKQLDRGADNTLRIEGVTNTWESYIPHKHTGNGQLSGGNPAYDQIVNIYYGTGTEPRNTLSTENSTTTLYSINSHRPQATTLHLLDVPPLRDQDDTIGMYWSACGVGTSDGWSMSLVRSRDAGVSFDLLASTDIPAALGWTTSILGSVGNPIPGLFDLTNTVTVQLRAGSLSSVTPNLAYENVCLIGNELLAFANAVQNANGTWTLSTLMRGLQGTDIFIGTHTANDQFTLLDRQGGTQDLEMQQSDLGLVYWYAGVTTYGTLLNSDKHKYALTGARIMPEAACHAQILRAANGDATISWVPRRRIGYEWIDSYERGVDESVEAYQVDILSPTGAVLSTKSTNWTILIGQIGSQTNQDLGVRQIVYTVAQQEADGLVPAGAAWTGGGFNLSADGLTATRNASGQANALSNAAGLAGLKFYFEGTPLGLAANSSAFGLVAGGNYLLATAIGNLVLNGVGVGSAGIQVNQACGVAVNFATMRAWIRQTPSSSWNGNPLADPVAGVAGIDISSFGSASSTYAAFQAWINGELLRANFGASAFAGAAPTGYSAGWPGTGFPPITATIYQISTRIGRGFPRTVAG